MTEYHRAGTAVPAPLTEQTWLNAFHTPLASLDVASERSRLPLRTVPVTLALELRLLQEHKPTAPPPGGRVERESTARRGLVRPNMGALDLGRQGRQQMRGGRSQSRRGREGGGCLRPPWVGSEPGPCLVKCLPRALHLSGLSISILPLLPWLKCILVITSLITAKAVCLHAPAKTRLLPCRDSCSSAQRE